MFRDNSQSGVGGFPATRQRDVYSYQKFYLAKAFLFCPQKLSLGRAASTTNIVELAGDSQSNPLDATRMASERGKQS